MSAADNNELKLLDNASREFARKVLAPEREETDKFPFGPFFSHILEKAFGLDFFHITLPEDLGGVGHGLEALCVVLDNICQEDSSLGGIIFTNAFAQQIILAAGAGDMLKGLPADPKKPTASLIACPVLCNPSETPVRVTAVKEGNSYHLSGTVNYVVMGGLAGQALIPATVQGGTGYTWFLINPADSSVAKSDPVMSHGLHACPAVDMTLNKTVGRAVGDLNQGAACFDKVFPAMQLVAAAMSCGIMKGSFNEAMGYCRQRSQGGRKIKDWSEMQMLLSNMAIQMQVADLLVSRAGRAMTDQEKNWQTKAQAAALHVISTAAVLATDGIQAMGGVGYMKDFGQEKRFRDAGQVQAFLGNFPMKKISFIKQIL
ncbi:MAG: acyl-CoA dehydrogenase family protein [Thermodesulfobacteriota bacterium]